MNEAMQNAQSDLVNALLDEMPESGGDQGESIQRTSGWEQLYLHAQYADMGGATAHFAEGTGIARRGNTILRLPLPINSAAQAAMERIHKAYVEAGHGFWRFNLTINADWRYDFSFDRTPSLVLVGQPDEAGRGRLNRHAAAFAAERGLEFE